MSQKKGKRGLHPNSQANLVTTKFKPGQSGNPGGRPKGFAARIKDRCGDDYDKLVEGLYLVAFGTPKQRKDFFGASVRVSTRDRIACIVELRDSGPGRPAVAVEVVEHQMAPVFAFVDGDIEGVSVDVKALNP